MNDESGTLVLTRSDVVRLLDLDSCITAVEEAFGLHGAGATIPPAILSVPVTDGGFHVKAGVLNLDHPYYAAKSNGNFPANPARHGLPTIQGVIVLADAECGMVLALIESAEITALRTAAASAVAAKYLSTEHCHVATIVGCGIQGTAQLRALVRVRPLELVFALDIEPGRAESFASTMSKELGIEVRAAEHLTLAARQSDIIATCTTATAPFLDLPQLKPGAFIAAVGADNPDKCELHPRVLGESLVVADVLEQSATIGELHHARAAGFVTQDDQVTELGKIVAGRAPGRTSATQIVVFDSTGMALQDVAAAAVVYRRARESRAGLRVRLNR